jgi:hypothetical protein
MENGMARKCTKFVEISFIGTRGDRDQSMIDALVRKYPGLETCAESAERFDLLMPWEADTPTTGSALHLNSLIEGDFNIVRVGYYFTAGELQTWIHAEGTLHSSLAFLEQDILELA